MRTLPRIASFLCVVVMAWLLHSLALRPAHGVASRPPVLRNGEIPIGSLGHPLGSSLTVEGIVERTLVPSLRVDRINGKRLPESVQIPIDGSGLPADRRCVLKGYETAQMIGLAPAAVAAAKDSGTPVPAVQAAWSLQLKFVVLSIVEPER